MCIDHQNIPLSSSTSLFQPIQLHLFARPQTSQGQAQGGIRTLQFIVCVENFFFFFSKIRHSTRSLAIHLGGYWVGDIGQLFLLFFKVLSCRRRTILFKPVLSLFNGFEKLFKHISKCFRAGGKGDKIATAK